MEPCLRKYIGRDYDSYNCLDLVREFYQDQFGLEIKNYYEGETPDRREVSSLIATNKGDFVKVDSKDRKFGDLIVIRLYGLECHIGVYIKGSQFIHSAKNIGSCYDRIERYSRLIVGYYRHTGVTP